MALERIRCIMLALPVVLFLCLSIECTGKEDIYCGTSPEEYLTGRFIPAKLACFVDLEKEKLPAVRKDMYLRRETAAALKNMLTAFYHDHPSVKVSIRSATRTFFDQRYIWTSKWTGERRVMGRDLKKEVADPRQRALVILEYSSMPGTSRHHWGTDVDLNSLVNSYFEKGEGRILYRWLKTNGRRFGFGQPYTAGREAGYQEEKWHWSYLPLAVRMLNDWNRLIRTADPKKLKIDFPGRDAAWHLAPVYVNGISGECR